MSRATLVVLAVSLLQYAVADDFVRVPWRNCTVIPPEWYQRRLRENPDALACQPQVPVSRLNEGLPFCECTYDGEGTLTKLLEFNAIVFGDFTTYGGQDILGRLAVQGNLNAPNYVVNANVKPVCYAQNVVPWDELALAVGGNIISTDTEVHGHWWTGGSGAAIELNEGCDSPAAVDTPFPFSDVLSDVLSMSQKIALQAPDLVLSEDGELQSLADISLNCYHVITLSPCSRDPLVCLLLNHYSSPNAILYGIGNWNGPSTPYPEDGKTLIINVPVYDGTAFEITTNQPSQGANSCKLIWNFYPVDTSGNYLSSGSFTIIRHTGSPFTGVVIAPLGDVIDGSSSVFEGSFFVKSYMWEHMNGVEIHDTPPCDNYHFCVPDVKTTNNDATFVPPLTVSSTFDITTPFPITTSTAASSSETSTTGTSTTETSTTEASSETSTSTTTSSTIVTPTVEPTITQTGYYTYTYTHGHHHDHDHDDDYDWHNKKKDKGDDKDWHDKEKDKGDDKDWHDKDHGKDHDKGYH
ncbi:unnamed protein product [Umbelopsis ramanniana]